jgi:hypothetical protein
MGEREKFKTFLNGDRGNYGRERDVSLIRGRERKIILFYFIFKKKNPTDWANPNSLY